MKATIKKTKCKKSKHTEEKSKRKDTNEDERVKGKHYKNHGQNWEKRHYSYSST